MTSEGVNINIQICEAVYGSTWVSGGEQTSLWMCGGVSVHGCVLRHAFFLRNRGSQHHLHSARVFTRHPEVVATLVPGTSRVQRRLTLLMRVNDPAPPWSLCLRVQGKDEEHAPNRTLATSVCAYRPFFRSIAYTHVYRRHACSRVCEVWSAHGC